jgi:glutamine synthetase
MLHEELTFVGTCDIAGLVRGKGFPSSELKRRRKTGIGWTHSNLMQTCFGPIFDTPFGTGGDLMMVPDPSAEVRVDFGEGIGAPVEHFVLGDIRNTDGSPWECCPREFLRRAIAALQEASGLELTCAFEQEFVYTGIEDRPGHPYSLSAFRRQGPFGESLVAALRAAA